MTSKPQDRRLEEILRYWFGQLERDNPPPADYYKLWFAKLEETDLYIKANFENDLLLAKEGELKDWEETPRGFLPLSFCSTSSRGTFIAGVRKLLLRTCWRLSSALKGLKRSLIRNFILLKGYSSTRP